MKIRPTSTSARGDKSSKIDIPFQTRITATDERQIDRRIYDSGDKVYMRVGRGSVELPTLALAV